MRTQRVAWTELPAAVTTEVETRPGTAVVGFEERQGGFSFGVLGAASLADGDQVFVKAVRDDAENVQDYRTEAVVGRDQGGCLVEEGRLHHRIGDELGSSTVSSSARGVLPACPSRAGRPVEHPRDAAAIGGAAPVR